MLTRNPMKWKQNMKKRGENSFKMADFEYII